MNHSESIVKLACAMSKAQGAIKGAKKDSVNPHFKATYADLESTWEACREPLSKNGLSVIQFPYSRDGKIGIETMLLHDSGEWIRGEIDVKMTSDTNPQIAGSIVTYLRRYSLQGAVGIAPADDDANAASPKPPAAVPTTQPGTVKSGEAAPVAATKEGEKDLDTLRRDLDELGVIAVEAQIYGKLGDAIQDFLSDEKFKSKCRSVDGITKVWVAEKAIKKANAVLNSLPARVDEGSDQDIPV